MALKMKKEHYKYLEDKLNQFLKHNPEVPDVYEQGLFQRANKVKNLQRRFDWDVLGMAVGTRWVCDNLYPYLNDRNIEAALNRILPKVVQKYF